MNEPTTQTNGTSNEHKTPSPERSDQQLHEAKDEHQFYQQEL